MSDTLQIRFADTLSEAEALELMAKLQRHGLTVIALDAETGEEVHRVEPKIKAPKVQRDERGLTSCQAVMLDLMMRPEGATHRELMEAGASKSVSPNWLYLQMCVTRATKGRYAKIGAILREDDNRPEVKAFRMAEVAEADRARVLYDTEAYMVGKGQIKAILAPQPGEVVPFNGNAPLMIAAE